MLNELWHTGKNQECSMSARKDQNWDSDTYWTQWDGAIGEYYSGAGDIMNCNSVYRFLDSMIMSILFMLLIVAEYIIN